MLWKKTVDWSVLLTNSVIMDHNKPLDQPIRDLGSFASFHTPSDADIHGQFSFVDI